MCLNIRNFGKRTFLAAQWFFNTNSIFMKHLFFAAIGVILLTAFSMKSNAIYDIHIKGLMGEEINLADYQGKKILFVNVASECGYTPQYAALQELYAKHHKDLMIIGVPCNQFGGQEPGSAAEIKSFCTKNYGVEFVITEKVDVKGSDQHPLYQWLTQKEKNGVETTEVKWNFQKYLIDENGHYVAEFDSGVDPMGKEIARYLN